ncbi:fimbrial protein [Morganella psychrotolerans]|uniref:fimbrial protein n=1 Tax=Morganella psychrotolerans TaxID=368603 RepID=UPI0039B09F4F
MHKKLIVLSIAALFGTTAAQAANQTSVEFLGNVQAISCDISVNGQSQVSLGTVKTSDFSTANSAITAGQKEFQIALTGCDTPAAAGTASLEVSGDTVSGTNNIFLQKSKNPTSNVGVMLMNGANPVENGSLVEIGKVTQGEGGALNPLTDNTVTLTAAYASTATSQNVTVGTFNAPVLFSFVYQ